MIVEYVRYKIPATQSSDFEAAYAQAAAALDASDHCLGYELARGVEEPDRYVLRIHWDSLDGHERGFRGSAEFQPFLAAVGPFFGDIEEMRHYEPTQVTGGRAQPLTFLRSREADGA